MAAAAARRQPVPAFVFIELLRSYHSSAMGRALIAIAVVLAVTVVSPVSASPTAKLPTLKAWVGGRGSEFIGISKVTWHGPVVTRLRPGSYTMLISDSFAAFYLVGPGIYRSNAPTSRSNSPLVKWRIKLIRGSYAYGAAGMPGERVRRFVVR